MAKPFQITGLDKLMKKLDKAAESIKEEVSFELQASAMQIAAEAQRKAPVDLGFLRNGISHMKINDLTFDVVSNAIYSPYVEFGTGALVAVPAGLESYAIQFKGKGIKEVNLPPQPFFFPAFEKEKPELVKRVKEVLQTIK